MQFPGHAVSYLKAVHTARGIDRRAVEVVVVGYSQDRMVRTMGDLPAVANSWTESGGCGPRFRGRSVSGRAGRVGFYVSGSVATDEAEPIKARTAAGIAEAAMNGRPHGIVS
jgi:hypothetical protein